MNPTALNIPQYFIILIGDHTCQTSQLQTPDYARKELKTLPPVILMYERKPPNPFLDN